MALLGYFKGEPTEYLLIYSGGKLRRSGPGLAFYYWAPKTSIASVPTGTIDVQFILNETTGNFQAVTLQGQLTFRITKPQAIASILNFGIDPRTRAYKSKDPEKLSQRIVNEVQSQARAQLLKLPLDDALRQSAEIAASVLAQVKQAQALTEIVGL